MTDPIVTPNPWDRLRRYTPARIALGRSGISQPTQPHLDFQLAHAQARDAVHHRWDVAATASHLHAMGLSTLRAHSAAADRPIYLLRPDQGRLLDAPSTAALRNHGEAQGEQRFDLGVVVADGLSALAVERHAAPFLAALQAALADDTPAWRLAPVVLVAQGRVAIGDPIGELLRVNLMLVLIGERPGLSSPDSMGLYFTWAPQPGCTDAQRNCISNVRPQGLGYEAAAQRAAYLLRAARDRQLTGVQLKDESAPSVTLGGSQANFLLADTGP